MALAAWGQISHDAATKILSGDFSLFRWWRSRNILGGVFSWYKTGLDNTLKKHFLISVKTQISISAGTLEWSCLSDVACKSLIMKDGKRSTVVSVNKDTVGIPRGERFIGGDD